MKRIFNLLVLTILLIMPSNILMNNCVALIEVHGEWYALIVCGSSDLSFRNNTAYMHHVLSEHYNFDGIIYLSVYPSDPGVNASATKNSVRSAITNTLVDWADEEDMVFVYLSSHGGGYCNNYGFGPFIFHTTYYRTGDNGRVSFETTDENGAHEIQENSFRLSQCPRILVYYDLDDDGVSDDFYYDYDEDERIEMMVDVNGNFYAQELPYIDVDGDGVTDDLFADIGPNDRTDILQRTAHLETSG